MMIVNCKDLPGQYINIIRTNQALVANSADLVVGGQEKRKRLKELSFPAMKLSALAIEEKKL
jgi:hypothetical protein